MTTKKPPRPSVSDALLVAGIGVIVAALWLVALPLGLGALGCALVFVALALHQRGA